MQTTKHNNNTDKRAAVPNAERNWWQQLSAAQKSASSTLKHFGYELAFVRSTDKGSMAVLLREDRAATVDDCGDINTQPAITLRH